MTVASVVRTTQSPEPRICVLIEERAPLDDLVRPVIGFERWRALYIVACSRHDSGLDALRCESERRPEADLVYLEAGCVVAPGWLDRLQEAAYADSITATVSPMTVSDTIVALSTVGGRPSVDSALADRAAEVEVSSTRMYPVVPPGLTHVLYVKRMAYELLGGVSTAVPAIDAALEDLTARAVSTGMVNVLADQVLVSTGAGTAERSHERVRKGGAKVFASGVVREALQRAVGVPRPMRILVDGSRLDAPITGTQVHILELAAALSQRTDIDVGLMMPGRPHPSAQRLLDQRPSIRLVEPSLAPAFKADVFHRPFQVAFASELAVAARLGRRFVVTHQDLIGYGNPDYYPSRTDWQEYRVLTRRVLQAADAVMTFSSHTRRAMAREGLAEAGRLWVVPIGVDSRADTSTVETAPTPTPGGGDLIMCLGNDFRHKNRLFALRVCEELRHTHGWQGTLVLAGPHAAHGSSWDDETEWLAARPGAGQWVVRMGEVSEEEKRWLLSNASLTLYPTVIEGFGLIPFESAASDVPCAFAPTASLGELFSSEAFSLVPWKVAASARALHALLVDPERRQAVVNGVQGAGRTLTWHRTAEQAVAVYENALARPSRAVDAPFGGL